MTPLKYRQHLPLNDVILYMYTHNTTSVNKHVTGFHSVRFKELVFQNDKKVLFFPSKKSPVNFD